MDDQPPAAIMAIVNLTHDSFYAPSLVGDAAQDARLPGDARQSPTRKHQSVHGNRVCQAPDR